MGKSTKTQIPSTKTSPEDQVRQNILQEESVTALQLFSTDCVERLLWIAQAQNRDVDYRLWETVDLRREIIYGNITRDEALQSPSSRYLLRNNRSGGRSLITICLSLFSIPTVPSKHLENARSQALVIWNYSLMRDTTQDWQWYLDRLELWRRACSLTMRYWLVYEEDVPFPLDITPIWTEAYETIQNPIP